VEGWASVKSAAEYAGISERTMRDWLGEGLRHSRMPSGMIRIKYQDIDDYIEKFSVDEHKVDRIVDEVFAKVLQ
jgi:excisionase family DNA binding protein